MLDAQPHTRLDARHLDRGASLDPAPMSCGSRQGPRWHCAWTLGHQEYRALKELLAQGFDTYLPLHLDRGTRHIGPLFPKYLFVRFDPAIDAWGAIRNTYGVGGLICYASANPSPVPIGVIENLQARTSERRIVDDPGECPEASRIRAGASGTVLQGPWAGWTGICTLSRRDRLTLLLALFGRQVPVSLRHDQVIAA
jgi:transcriptional antiterminator RfaH